MSTPVYADRGLYVATQPYNQCDAFQIPTTILEPADIDAENGMLRLNCRPFNLNLPRYGNPEFLRAITTAPLQQVSYSANKYNWTYKSRHLAQPILPFLYLGPAPVARDASFISGTGITMVVAVRNAASAAKQPKWLDPSRFPACSGLETTTFDVDNPYEFITRIRPVIRSMTAHLASRTQYSSGLSLEDVKGRILVVCESGNERSPALVAAYIMLLYGIPWHQSLNFIHTHRFSVCLSSGMNEMLKTWQGILQAESDVAPLQRVALVHSTELGIDVFTKKSTKRGIDDAYDSDETMTDEHEIALRPGIAPFMDSHN